MRTTDARSALILSLVIPAYNEAFRFGEGFSRLTRAIDAGAVDPERTEFIVVDDGSTDRTAHKADELFSRFPHYKLIQLERNSGKGAAVRSGVAAARGAIVIFADADMAIDPRQIPSVMDALETADIAIGSRSIPGSSVDGDSASRTFMSRAFNWTVNAVTHLSLSDTQCGFKGFRTPVARLLFECSQIDRFAFDVELLCLARRFGLRITEVPVHWQHVHGSRIRRLADPYSMIKDIFRARSETKNTKKISAVAVETTGLDRDEVATHILDLAGDNLVLASPDAHDVVVLFTLDAPGAEQTFTSELAVHAPTAKSRSLDLRVNDLRRLAPFVVLNQGPTGSIRVPRAAEAAPAPKPSPSGGGHPLDSNEMTATNIGATPGGSGPGDLNRPEARAVAGF